MVQLLLPIIYISFISLGLPDSLLGSAWPSMYPALGVPVSYAGLISMIISFGTIVSSLNSDRLTRALGTGKVTALSVAMTAAALFGFSVSTQFWMLCLWAVPYGLGAGSVDAALNNYVALHYKSRHMSWLHCMWGIGTMISPMVMGRVLAGGGPWTSGYRYIALFQILLSAVLFFSLPLWQSRTAGTDTETASTRALSLGQVFRLPGAREVMLCFFCYCALETTAGLWASSYLTLTKGVSAGTAASFASRHHCRARRLRLFDPEIQRYADDPHGSVHSGRRGAGSAAARAADPCPERSCSGRAGLCAHLSQHHPLHAGTLRRGQIAGGHRHPDGKRLFGQSGHAAAVRPAGKQHHSGTVSFLPAGTAGAHGIHARTAGAQNKLLLILPFSYFIYSKRLPVRSRAGSLLF